MTRSTRFLGLLFTAAACVAVSLVQPAHAGLTPESPEVKQAVARAVKYLEGLKSPDNRMGAHAIRATVILKSGGGEDHPLVQTAIREIRKELSYLDRVPKDHVVYSASLSLIFFCTLDTQRYKPEIERLLQYLLSIQKPHGGWGYEEKPTGDTSMTQHCILALWEAAEKGFNVPQASIERAAVWFFKTQDPSGAFGYQGTVSDSYQPVKQTDLRHSCAAAGMGSVYMAAELLGIGEKLGQRKRDADSLPPGLVKVKEAGSGPLRFRSQLDPGLFRTVMGRGNRWLEENHIVHPAMWPHYHLYSIERYWTFRELIEGNTDQVNRWYDEAARWLLEVQNEDGSWLTPHISTVAETHTCFSALFLLRSTQKTVQQVRSLGAGTLVGGRGLPSDSEFVQMQGGKIVSRAEMSDIEKLITNLREGNDEQFTKTVGVLPELPPDEAKALVSQAAARLRDLAGGTSADLRLGAVQALARAGTLDDVPMLIYALTDPEAEIVLAARDGLRRISRKIRGFGLPDDFDEGDRVAAVKAWKEWYSTIRPDAEFLN